MKVIYRIENQNGYGPYTGNHKYSWKDEGHDSRVPLAEHSSLYNDYKEIRDWCEESEENFPDLLIYGFSSMEQLESWFSESELYKLRQLGYDVVLKKVSKIFHLNKQVVCLK